MVVLILKIFVMFTTHVVVIAQQQKHIADSFCASSLQQGWKKLVFFEEFLGF